MFHSTEVGFREELPIPLTSVLMQNLLCVQAHATTARLSAGFSVILISINSPSAAAAESVSVCMRAYVFITVQSSLSSAVAAATESRPMSVCESMYVSSHIHSP